MNRVLTSVLLPLLFSLAPFTSAKAETLDLRTYVEQIRGTSPGLKASELSVAGSLEASKEGHLQYIPRFTVNGNLTRDERLSVIPFQGGKTSSNALGLGLEKLFDFGLSSKISYNLVNNATTNSPFFPGSQNIYSAGQAQLDLTQSLWRNFFGQETRATETLAEASSLITHYSEKFHLKQILAQAESNYYRLSIARESVALLQDVLDRSQKILGWNTKRVERNLADRIDLLQARAANQARQLDLETGLNEAKSAELAFNSLRNSSSSEVPETLSAISTADIIALEVPKRADVSDDVKAAEQNERITVANHELARQRAQPDASAYATIAYNGVDRYLSPAVDQSLTTNHPYYVLGVRLSFPIYFWETSEIRSGRVKEQLAAESLTREKKLESDQTWNDLTRRFSEAKSRLRLADSLVTMETDKLKYEKYRFNLGRTTTYQVLTFEQDYTTSILARLRIEQEILSIHAQLKTYAEGTAL